MASAHHGNAVRPLDLVGDDVHPELDHRHGDTAQQQGGEQHGGVDGEGRQRHCNQERRQGPDDRGTAADPGNDRPGERNCQDEADRQSEQSQRQVRRSKAEPLLDLRNARQPATEGDRLQKKGEHDEIFGSHEISELGTQSTTVVRHADIARLSGPLDHQARPCTRGDRKTDRGVLAAYFFQTLAAEAGSPRA